MKSEESDVSGDGSLLSRWSRSDLPLLHSGEVKSHLTVGEGLLVQVSSVPSDERRHVVA